MIPEQSTCAIQKARASRSWLAGAAKVESRQQRERASRSSFSPPQLARARLALHWPCRQHVRRLTPISPALAPARPRPCASSPPHLEPRRRPSLATPTSATASTAASTELSKPASASVGRPALPPVLLSTSSPQVSQLPLSRPSTRLELTCAPCSQLQVAYSTSRQPQADPGTSLFSSSLLLEVTSTDESLVEPFADAAALAARPRSTRTTS